MTISMSLIILDYISTHFGNYISKHSEDQNLLQVGNFLHLSSCIFRLYDIIVLHDPLVFLREQTFIVCKDFWYRILFFTL